MIIEKNTESELADYVSDDFGLIYDSFVLNYKDEWLEKVIAAYKNKKYSNDFSEQNFAQASRQAVIDMRNDLNRVR